VRAVRWLGPAARATLAATLAGSGVLKLVAAPREGAPLREWPPALLISVAALEIVLCVTMTTRHARLASWGALGFAVAAATAMSYAPLVTGDPMPACGCFGRMSASPAVHLGVLAAMALLAACTLLRPARHVS